MNRNCEFTIIIVSWNTKQLLLQCIQAIYFKNLHKNFEIMLIDNASTDGSAQYIKSHFPNLTIIENKENVGYARANNQGIMRAKGNFILLLNSDTKMESEEPLVRLKDYFVRHSNIGILGATLKLPDGRIQSQGHQFLTIKSLLKQQLMFSSAPLFKKSIKKKHQSEFEADYVDGAFLCIRKSVIEDVGLLNEQYFMYGEDMELCYRAKRAGWKAFVLPDIVVLHEHAASSRQNFRRVLFVNALNNSRFIYATQGLFNAKIAFATYLLGMLLRIPISLIRHNGLAGKYVMGFWDGIQKFGKLSELLEVGSSK